MTLKSVHHIAVICSDYVRSKEFYTIVLGLEILAETYRPERKSHKLDLGLNGLPCIELFSFPSPPPRPSHPESCGLRHLAFRVDDLTAEMSRLKSFGIECEIIRIDEHTGKRFTFFSDPDGLPLELYEDQDQLTV